MKAQDLIKELENSRDEERARHCLRYFKTGKGEYGEGDLFYGLTAAIVKKIVKKYYKELEVEDLDELISHPYHESRTTAVLILVSKFEKALIEEKEKIYNYYLKNVNYINNWDLVDISAPHIVGAFLHKKDMSKLWKLAQSGHLWSERISVVATLYFIKNQEYEQTLKLAEHFLSHKHDLMHKAVGWMLRETGKKDLDSLYSFLDKFHKTMPRTMLRYSLEKLPKDRKDFYMKK